MLIQTLQSPNVAATASPTRNEDCTNLGGWEHEDGIYVTTHHKRPDRVKEKKKPRYGEVHFPLSLSIWMFMNCIVRHHCDRQGTTNPLSYQGLDDPAGKS